jgi:lipopolysaccharide export system protein LptA
MTRVVHRGTGPAADCGYWRAARKRALLCCFVAALAAPAAAEKADRDKPVNLEADKVTIDDARQTALFEGNVVLTQGTLQIRGDRMEVRQDKDGFQHGTAWGGPAHFRQKREGYDEYIEGSAERIEYDGRAEAMQMFNRAQLKRGSDEVRGNYISYDAKSEFFQATGGAKNAETSGSAGRVRAVIQPKSTDKPPAGPPVSLKPAETIVAPREETGTRRK